MLRRRVPSVLLTLACALLLGAAAPAAGALTRDAQTRQNVRLLKTYIDAYAGEHRFVCPAAALVKKGGGLTAPVWPVNPWTGRAMAAGTGRGAYSYLPGPGGDGYTLRARLTSGSFAVTGSTPSWLADERRTAADALQDALGDAASARAQLAAVQGQLTTTQSQLDAAQSQLSVAQSQLTAKQSELDAANIALAAAQAALAPARRQAAELGGRLIKSHVEQWGMLNNGTAPAASEVSKSGAVGVTFPDWPDNPYTGSPMTTGSQQGDYTYSAGNGGAYTMDVNTGAAAPVNLDGNVPQQLTTALNALRTALTNANLWKIQNAVDTFALFNADVLPATATQATLDTFLDPWPLNPWTDQSMTPGTQAGDYTYSVDQLSSTYTLTAHLPGTATGEVLDGDWWRLNLGLRDRLKNVYCQASLQVVKEYIEEWKAAHGGALPTSGQLTRTGAVGAAHSWWPANPWTGMPMANADQKGDIQYSPAGDGTYTLTVRQQPLDPYQQYYAAQ